MISPAFETQYDVHPGPARIPFTDATLTTAPRRSIRCGNASFVVRNAPVRLIRSVFSHCSSDSSSSGPLSPTPALLTSASMPPKRSTVALIVQPSIHLLQTPGLWHDRSRLPLRSQPQYASPLPRRLVNHRRSPRLH